MSSLPEFKHGQSMHERLFALFPICRSITGNGVRATLAELQTTIPLSIHEVPSGTQVFDWKVPNEWNISDAWIKNTAGERVVDFKRNNLHVVNYSTPILATMSLAELRGHLHTLPSQPDVIPYRTSYYKEDWGFCLSQRAMDALPYGQYEVCINSTLAPGSLTFGELFLPGTSSDEVLFSTHVCHPSLANDNLSGVVVAAALAAELRLRGKLRYCYRFLFIPGTIGAITWLARNVDTAHRIQHGLILSGVGDSGPFTYKKSRQGNARIDRVVPRVLEGERIQHSVQEFSPYGYDERQFCSAGFNLPMGCFSRTPYGKYPEYHTSNDHPAFVKPESLAESLRALLCIVDQLESEQTFVNTKPKCEPQLGRRGLYGELNSDGETMAMLWLLNMSDGTNSLHDIAERATIPIERLVRVAKTLESHGLLEENRGTGVPPVI
jgi:aminopeptidase-like protein